ncbi:MAG: aminodeoxychorismate synthase component I [Nitrosomonadales bacterium]|nr:aminodeoxychorismate synthase component I [Nitrosomonadales bacterium]
MSACHIPLPYRADASTYFAVIGELPWAAWLDSGGRGRHDILTAQPFTTLITEGVSTAISDIHSERHSNDDPFDLLRNQLGAPLPKLPGIPFAGGALGYWGYDLARRWVSLPEHTEDAEHLPEMAIGLYDWALVVDHQQQTAQLVSHLRQPQTAEFLARLAERLVADAPLAPATFRVSGAIRSNFTQASYAAAFDTVQRYLHAGDCYQVNLAQRFSAPAQGDAYAAYLALREISPAPFAAFLALPQAQILCASPERFLRVLDGQVETKPIKGTRPRSADAATDAANRADLRSHPKDRAENLMIVDLLRNDLGRCCVPGSVRTPELFAVESHANVHHLVSTVTGELAAGEDALSLLRACFPGGSITGAPKQRAMQIIEELEPQRRGVYCGAIGYVGFDGNMDCNIAIRTLVFSGKEVRCWAGGGLIADSVAAAEYQETLDKASGMLTLLRRIGG